MSALADQEDSRSMLQAIWRWFSPLSEMGTQELSHLSKNEIDHIAADLGISPSELYRLVRSDSRSAELLKARMAALNLDCKEVAQLMPETLHDLQRLCTLCNRHKRCARDLGSDPLNPKWKNYCPNVGTLMAIDAMPWAARKEW